MQRPERNFALLLMAEMERRGWTQTRLAAELERIAAELGRPDVTVSQQVVSTYLRGVVPREPVRRAAIARFLELEPGRHIGPPQAPLSRQRALGQLRVVLRDAGDLLRDAERLVDGLEADDG